MEAHDGPLLRWCEQNGDKLAAHQSGQPLPGVLDFRQPGVGVLPAGEELLISPSPFSSGALYTSGQSVDFLSRDQL